MLDADLESRLRAWLTDGWTWFHSNVLEPERLVELAVVLVAYFAGRITAGFLLRIINIALERLPLVQAVEHPAVRPILASAVTLLLVWSAKIALEPVLGAVYILPLATSLLTAWIVIRGALIFVANRELARLLGVAVWSLAALNILGILPTILSTLDGANLPIGDSEVSVLDILTGLALAGVLVWAALMLSAMLEKQLQSMTAMPASAAVLIAKAGRIALLTLAILVALNTSGIDLTALAVFGGALGVGIGFGLQKVVGNFISGLILLLDRSIKPGDVIEITETYGRINKMAARYTSVITRDGTEYLIPNEDMITQPVINWSHSNLLVRRKVPVQISYSSDLHKAVALMNEAASEEARVITHPEPRTLLKGFGSDGVDLELRFWIKDPENGVSNIASDVMLRIWDKFYAGGIEFPFPQRDIHIKTGELQQVHPATVEAATADDPATPGGARAPD